MNLSSTQALACELIRCKSVTPEDAGCQDLLIERLEKMGFTIHRLKFGPVVNFWAVRNGDGSPSDAEKPLLCFAGHTDVVPEGPLDQWETPPYEPTLVDGNIRGRGAADMKGSLAAMLTACERFVAEHPDHSGQLAWLITADEEGIATDGTVKVIEWLSARDTTIDYCIVGEPSSTRVLGDVIKNGRRGSINMKLTVKGKQGHVAYPHLATNPIHTLAPALTELTSTHWDEGNDFFPATSLQVTNVNAGEGATNVIPGTCEVVFNIRFNTEQTPEQIENKILEILDRHELVYDIDFALSGLPFLTKPGALVNAAQAAIKDVQNIDAELSTSGGTSDGRFIAPTGAQVLELGPINASIHQVNEEVSAQDLDRLSEIYEGMLSRLIGSSRDSSTRYQ